MGLKSSDSLLKTGVIGSVIAVICCSTPVLVIAFGTVGLGALTGYLDNVLLPVLAVFVGITLYAMNRKQRGTRDEACPRGRQPRS